MPVKRIAVLASGRGSNFQAVIDAIDRREIPASCCGLITDNPGAYSIERAEKAGVPVYIVDYAAYPTKEAYEQALCRVMEELSADLYILAGYMRILGSGIVKQFHGRLMNIHPALLPGFPGLHAQRQALGYGVKVSGCTVHFVDEGMDSGPVIVQACVPVEEEDEEETLSARILAMEHRCLPEAIRLFCEDRLMVEGRRVRILPGRTASPGNTRHTP
ncbi:MAG: phosphoribosylglycinamide formyltransferase [Methanoregulaceae archaeon]|nr:phosphoribosylglycinamide formyltransferase [Methanoregulaceae archaeon]